MKRKGFTLIELLAVIVILAIIAVIATPIIVGIIEDSRKAAFERSVEGIIHATDLDYSMQEVLSNDTYTITNGQLDKTLKTPIKNLEGFNGTIKYDEKGNSQFAIHNGKWCMMKDSSGVISITEYDAQICKLATTAADSCFVTKDLENGSVSIVNYLCSETDVIIPDTINEKTVTEISGLCTDYDGWSSCEGAFEKSWIYDDEGNGSEIKIINSVIIPKTVVNIDNRAFASNFTAGELDLSYLTNLTSIGDNAFSGGSFTSIKFPTSLKSIGNNSFEYCDLEGELDLSYLINLESIEQYAFMDDYEGRGSITSVKLPSSLKNIGTGAFEGQIISGVLDLSNLTELTVIQGFSYNEIEKVIFPDNVNITNISDFYANKISGELDLTKFTNLKFVSKLGGNDDITNLKLPKTIEEIGDDAFSCYKLTGELDLSEFDNLRIIGENAFNCEYSEGNQFTSIKFPKSIEEIKDNAFSEVGLSGELDLSELINLKYINGFSRNRISNINLPVNLITIGGNAFTSNRLSGELDLQYLTKLTTIEDEVCCGVSGAFDSNDLTSVKLPKNLTYIGESAFNYNNLESVTFVGRTNLDGVTLGDYVWGWADGYSDSNIGFSN